MKADDRLMEILMHFGKDQIKVLGKGLSKGYLKRCFVLWAEKYGDSMCQKIRPALMAEWTAAK